MAGRILVSTARGIGVIGQAVNYTRAVIRYHRNRGYKLPLEMTQQRLEMCHQCSRYDPVKDRCSHRRCGCVVSEKVTWSTESCPEKLWLPMYGPAPAS